MPKAIHALFVILVLLLSGSPAAADIQQGQAGEKVSKACFSRNPAFIPGEGGRGVIATYYTEPAFVMKINGPCDTLNYAEQVAFKERSRFCFFPGEKLYIATYSYPDGYKTNFKSAFCSISSIHEWKM